MTSERGAMLLFGLRQSAGTNSKWAEVAKRSSKQSTGVTSGLWSMVVGFLDRGRS